MRLHEYQSKAIFTDYKIPIPRGRLASTPEEAKLIVEELNGPVVLKAQILVGGRGRAGGIRLVNSPDEAEEEAAKILGQRINDFPVRRLLVEEAVNIQQEIYFGMTIDRENGQTLLIASAEGGIDIEEVAQRAPERILRVGINPLLGLRDFQARNLATEIEMPRRLWRSFITIAHNLYQSYLDLDMTLAEINPLVITTNTRLIALDGKITIDDNALFRHPDLVDRRDISAEQPEETEARKFCLSYIKLSGNIGCLVNGAGLAMATMDIIQHKGGQPANFLDIGGGASAGSCSTSSTAIRRPTTAVGSGPPARAPTPRRTSASSTRRCRAGGTTPMASTCAAGCRSWPACHCNTCISPGKCRQRPSRKRTV